MAISCAIEKLKDTLCFSKKHKNIVLTGPGGSTVLYDKQGNVDEKYTVLSKNCRLTMDTRRSCINNNVLILGDNEKERRDLMAANIRQANSSYIVFDADGELYRQTASHLREKGYQVRLLETSDRPRSCRYNPFLNLKTEEDVIRFIDYLMENTAPELGNDVKDLLLYKTESGLLATVILYMLEYEEKENQNFAGLLNLLERGIDDHGGRTADLDLLFKEVRKIDPKARCCAMWETWRAVPPQFRHIEETISRIEPLADDPVLNSMDSIDLSEMLFRPGALFVPVSGNSFAAGLIFMQGFHSLQEAYYRSINAQQNRRRYDIRFIMNGTEPHDIMPYASVPCFFRYSALMHRINMSLILGVSDISVLSGIYKEDLCVLTSNCDSVVYLGCSDPETEKFVSAIPQNSLRPDSSPEKGPVWKLSRDECFVSVNRHGQIIDRKVGLEGQ